MKLSLVILILQIVCISQAVSGPLRSKYPFNLIINESVPVKKHVKIAVIDTGVDFKNNTLRRSLLKKYGGELTSATKDNYGIDNSHKSTSPSKPKDLHGHGTHIAGIINEINPSAKLLVIKYFNPNASEESNLDATIRAINTAVEANVDIINYSSGGEGYNLKEYEALKKAQEKGILVIAAAGNNGKNIDSSTDAYYPASYNLNNIISVINLKSHNEIHGTSNYGVKNADIGALGTNIHSFIPGGRIATLSGTSQATAIISGYASLLINSRKARLDYVDIKNTILSSVKKYKFLEGKCKTEGIFSPKLFFQKLKSSPRSLAQNKSTK